MRLKSIALAFAFVAAAGTAALADDLMSGSPKPSPSGMHSMMKATPKPKGSMMKATPKPSSMSGSHMMGSPSPKASAKP